MKHQYEKLIKKTVALLKSFKKLALSLIKDFKKDISFYSKHTEMLAIWTLLFLTICGFFFLAITNGIFAMFVFFVLAVSMSLVFYFSAIYYIHKVKNRKHLFAKTNNIFNKSFKLRSLLRFVKIPHVLLLSKLQYFKHLTKRGFKFASYR